MKVLGIIGGLGPMATAYFFELLIQMSEAKKDQEHMEVIIISKPSIPDRTGYILGRSRENPLPQMVEAGKRLKENGASAIAIPCITAHYFYQQLLEQIGLPVVNAVEATVDYLKKFKITQIGILATDGTIQSELFQKVFEQNGIQSVIPSQENQRKVMDIIYNSVKVGKEVDMKAFHAISRELFEGGAQRVLLACTELSLVKRKFRLPSEYLDVLELLAAQAVTACGKLKAEYKDLIV